MRAARRVLVKQRRAASSRHSVSFNNSCYSVNEVNKNQKRGYGSMEVIGGRSSQSGIVATVFGASGVMGRYVVSALGRFGSNVVVPFRGEPTAVHHLKTAGDLGQVVPVWWNPYHKESIRRAVQHSSLVINLVGSILDTKNFSLEDANIEVTRNIAEVCAEKDIRFIQLSAIGADPNSASRFARTKGEAELVLRSYLPKSTIVRPSPIFCMQDRWLNKIADDSVKGKGIIAYNRDTKVQPIYAGDLSNMIVSCILEDKTQGQTIEACGPTIYTMEQIYAMIQYMTLTEDKVRNYRPSVDTQRIFATIYENTFGGGYKSIPISTNEIDWYQASDLVETGKHLTRRDLGYTTDQLSDVEEVIIDYMRGWRETERAPLELKFIEPREALFLKTVPAVRDE
eukprot:TRINITY_DN19186_c0_g1_i1.p1 TRINITY_DN19186_c0_g1~~TRINITY_DN19186_c0_g1_i1.p1  ORF type:complete len:404 (-),score=83.06 TRINITY_DN19186_c0_g1_i1:60-1250(-)